MDSNQKPSEIGGLQTANSWRRSFRLGAKSFALGLLFAGSMLFAELMTKYFTKLRFGPRDFGNLLFLLSPSPFVGFDPNRGSIVFPFSQPGLDVAFDSVNMIFMLLVCFGYLVPIIKYSIDETGPKTSWTEASKTAARSAILGFVVITLVLGIPTIYYGSFQIDFLPETFLDSYATLIGSIESLAFLAAFDAVSQIPIRMFAVKLSSETCNIVCTTWKKSLLVSIKSVAMGWLFGMPLAFCALPVVFGTSTFLINTNSLWAYVLGTMIVNLTIYVSSILLQIPSISLFIKYLREELGKPRPPMKRAGRAL